MPAAIGITAAVGSAEKRMIRNPITAFQNPATIQGSVIANSTSSMTSIKPRPPGDSASAASASRSGHGGGKQRSKQHAPAEHVVSGGVGLHGLRWGAI